MNLQSAKALSDLRTPQPKKTEPKVRDVLQVARRVFKLAAQGGFPYKHQTPETWAKKWLSSKEFVLMEIDINAAASLNKPKNPARVSHYLHCSVESLDPIVVDVNKRKEGKTRLGYIPEVVVHDGKHRKLAQIMNGRFTIMAWVGKKALKKIKPSKIVKALHASAVHPNGNGLAKGSTAITEYLYGATVPGQGIPTVKQDAGVGGSRPVDSMHSKRKTVKKVKADCNACGARSSGSLESTPDPSDAKIPPDPSDASTQVSPSDRLEWNPKKAQLYAPGTGPGYTDQFGSPNLQTISEDSSSTRVTNKGASGSDFARNMHATAPPGFSEETMHKLKRKHGTKSAFKIAWSQHNQGK